MTLKLEINNGFRLFMPYINRHLALHSVKVPSNIFGIFLLSDLSISYFDQYIYLGMSPTFLAPAVGVAVEPYTEFMLYPPEQLN